MRYISAAHAFERWAYLHALTECGGLKSLDMLQACANVHNASTDVVVTDHPHLSELDERLELDRCMAIVLRMVGDKAFQRWGRRRMDNAKLDDQMRWVEGCIEVVLKQEGYLVCR